MMQLHNSGILPERMGYKFLGWESAIKTWINSKDANSNGEIIYKAKWESDGSVANLKYIVQMDSLDLTNYLQVLEIK